MIIIPEDALRIAEALSTPIDELGLSVRSYNGLRRWGITTVADVYRAYQNKQLPRIRNIGEKSVIEIEKLLEEHLAKVAPVNNSEIPNSSDTISRQAAIDAVNCVMVMKGIRSEKSIAAEAVESAKRIMTDNIRQLPPIQPRREERKIGEWIYDWGDWDFETCKCSECGNHITTPIGKRYSFCPNCGADMRGEQDE